MLIIIFAINILVELLSTQSDILPAKSVNEMEIEVTDIDLTLNSTHNITCGGTGKKQLADAKWLKDVRFAIEGVTQLLVGIVGLIGKTKII